MGVNGWPDDPAIPVEPPTEEPTDDPHPYPDEGEIFVPSDPNDTGPWV
jgi:hypothetical protein